MSLCLTLGEFHFRLQMFRYKFTHYVSTYLPLLGIHSFKMGALPALYHADSKGELHYNLIRHKVALL